MKKIRYRKRIASLAFGLVGVIFFALACVYHNKTEDFSNIITIQSGEDKFTQSEIASIRQDTASADTFTAWTEQKNQTVRATINERSTNTDILLLCGDSHSVLPWGKNLPESDTEGCIIGASLAEQLFGGTEVEGQQILYNGRELTVCGIVKQPQNIMLCQNIENYGASSGTQTGSRRDQQTGSLSENNQQEVCYDKISLFYIDKSKAMNRTAVEFINRYGLDGQILHYEYKRNLRWFTDLIPGKWSDFSGWKENFKTLQSDEKKLKQCGKSMVESLYLEWIWKRNSCFVLCVVMFFLHLTTKNLPLTSNLFTCFLISNILNSVKKSNNDQENRNEL